jgi:hypothetical protein
MITTALIAYTTLTLWTVLSLGRAASRPFPTE